MNAAGFFRHPALCVAIGRYASDRGASAWQYADPAGRTFGVTRVVLTLKSDESILDGPSEELEEPVKSTGELPGSLLDRGRTTDYRAANSPCPARAPTTVWRSCTSQKTEDPCDHGNCSHRRIGNLAKAIPLVDLQDIGIRQRPAPALQFKPAVRTGASNSRQRAPPDDSVCRTLMLPSPPSTARPEGAKSAARRPPGPLQPAATRIPVGARHSCRR